MLRVVCGHLPEFAFAADFVFINIYRESVSVGGTPAVVVQEESKDVKEDSKEEIKEKKSSLGFFSILKRGWNSSTYKPSKEKNAVKVKTVKKNVQDLADVRLLQTLPAHAGPIWCLAWSHCGTLFVLSSHFISLCVQLYIYVNTRSQHSRT